MKKLLLVFLAALLLPWGCAQAERRGILFIPHDDRPISYHQTVEVVESAGYEMLLPTKELLNSATDMGHPDELWQWLKENHREKDLYLVTRPGRNDAEARE